MKKVTVFEHVNITDLGNAREEDVEREENYLDI